jgi:hypothetical protein
MNKSFLSLVLFLLVVAAQVPAQETRQLFTIEHNTNSNSVYYEARIAGDSLLDSRQPIHAYWVMWAKDPTGKTREELTLLEKEKAFGFTVKRSPVRKFVWFSIVPLPNRLIKVSLQNGNPVAETVINGRFSILEKISIFAVSRYYIPHVNHIELFGRDVKCGEGTYEKIINK